MKEQFLNKVTQSVFMWAEHQLCDEGEAYQNLNIEFYDGIDRINGYYTYTCPYDQFVSDASVSGVNMPNLLTGVYVSGNYTNVGQGGFIAADFFQGVLYFDHEISNPNVNLTGNFAVKEVNTMMTNNSEEKLLFDTAYKSKMKTSVDPVGMKQNETNIPVIFIKYIGGHNEAFAFGGMDQCLYKYRLMLFCEDLFQLEACSSIFKDKKNTTIPLMESSDNPFNFLGYYKGATYNYDNIAATKTSGSELLTLSEVFVNTFDGFTVKTRKDIQRGVQLATIELEVLAHRNPRSS